MSAVESEVRAVVALTEVRADKKPSGVCAALTRLPDQSIRDTACGAE
jgi:hypothetical protein